jgi:prepilin-type N-terminal cleavage/methylation domain-containing protein
MDRTLRRRAGFSLVELMIAVGILVIVVTAVMQSFVVQNRAYTVTDQVIEAQQGLRAVAWLLERDARMTGFMVPEAAAVCAIDSTNGPDTVWFTDADALDPTGETRPALGAEVLSGYSAGTGSKPLGVDDAVLDAGGFYANGFDFQEDGGAILVDVDDPNRGVACGIVTNVSANTVTVDFATSLGVVPAGNRLILVPAHVYQVDLAPDEPQLLRNGRAIATGVEDLQVAFFFDQNRDGQVQNEFSPNGEFPGRAGADEYENDDYDNRDLREIRINLVTRTRAPDREFQVGQFQTTENRVAPGGNDGYRRRVHSSTVKLRNVGYRGTAT